MSGQAASAAAIWMVRACICLLAHTCIDPIVVRGHGRIVASLRAPLLRPSDCSHCYFWSDAIMRATNMAVIGCRRALISDYAARISPLVNIPRGALAL